MTTTRQNDPSLQHKVEGAKARVREAARRFQLPFGVLGKASSFKRALASESLVTPEVLIVQDVQLLIPPEYIFGLESGDCIALQTLFANARNDFFKDVDLAISLYRPALVVVSAAVGFATEPYQKLTDFMSLLDRSCPLLRSKIQQGVIGMDGCLVNDKCRSTEFFNRDRWSSSEIVFTFDAAAP